MTFVINKNHGRHMAENGIQKSKTRCVQKIYISCIHMGYTNVQSTIDNTIENICFAPHIFTCSNGGSLHKTMYRAIV